MSPVSPKKRMNSPTKRGKGPNLTKERPNYYTIMSYVRSLQRNWHLARYLGRKTDDPDKYWMIYGSAIYEEAYAISVGWYKHELGQIVAVQEARKRFVEGTYEHPSHYYLHADIPPRRLHPIPVHENISWETDVNSLPPLTPPVHPWSEPTEVGAEGPFAERLDDEWAPIILEGVRSVKVEDVDADEEEDGEEDNGPRKLDGAMKHVLRTFYFFTEEDFRKIDNVLANPRLHPKLVRALISGGVEEERAESLASWMLGTSSEVQGSRGLSLSGVSHPLNSDNEE